MRHPASTGTGHRCLVAEAAVHHPDTTAQVATTAIGVGEDIMAKTGVTTAAVLVLPALIEVLSETVTTTREFHGEGIVAADR